MRLEVHKQDCERRGQIPSAEGNDDFTGSVEARLTFLCGNIDTADVDTDAPVA